MKGVFVTGTDTGVGKTVVAAWLMRALDGDYWKPVQTGLAEGDSDSETVRRLSGFHGDRFHAPTYALQAPLSPQAAAQHEGVRITIAGFSLPQSSRPMVVEGAGGVLAPLGEGLVMAELIAHLGLSVVLVARTALGTINHSLLSLEALRSRGLEVAGMVFCGPPDTSNRKAVEQFGVVPTLGEVPLLDPLDAGAIATLANNAPPCFAEARHMVAGSTGTAHG